jgi:hypothetical protein
MAAWISVKDELPAVEGDEVHHVLALCGDGSMWVDPYMQEHGFAHDSIAKQMFGAEADGELVTHWMPLPEPPEK